MMKRVLTKKPQFSKTVMPDRQKRNLKFSHAPQEVEAEVEHSGPQILSGPVEMEVAAYEWAPPDEPVAPVVIEQQSRTLFQWIVAIVLPILGFGAVALVVAALAQAGGYDAGFIASRFQ
ncbi:hypothetical protein [Asticcacaulis sp. AND118]|uniref:hypothetical protein n=1 Tax=Asticcacaulis sp. AND118 TaxID=2840468 RepID=UPI001CFFA65E|nr:hypothetical protein [Asticcacaulis sp. AND118]UDF02942.1 hypothetical protein LH365_10935 [Asticcacaulis sp. AND118]